MTISPSGAALGYRVAATGMTGFYLSSKEAAHCCISIYPSDRHNLSVH